MPFSENFIEYQNSRLYYAKAGSGQPPLLLFHGFGQSHRAFEQWVKVLESNFTVYAFDLYFHGQSIWPDRQPLEKNDWQKILVKFLALEKITDFEVVGFSLGGKFALATLESFPKEAKRVILLAPDGIKTSLWYSLATYPIAIRYFFKSMILKPGRLYRIIKTLTTLRLIDKGLLRFAESQMDTEEKRRRVYYSWVYFRHLKFNLRQIAALINLHQIPVLVVVGKYDKVIPAKNMTLLLKRLQKPQLEIIDAGHNDLIRNAIDLIPRRP